MTVAATKKEESKSKAFWRPLEDREMEDDDDLCDYIRSAVKKDPALLHSRSSSALLHSKSSTRHDGLSLTEYLCQREPGPVVCDTLDELIADGVPVTERCYRAVCEGWAGAFEGVSYDMLSSLIQSGSFPEIDGKLTMDYVVSEACGDSPKDWEENSDDFFEFFMDYVPDMVSKEGHYEKLQEGTSHASGGLFSEWIEWARAKESEDEDTVTDNEDSDEEKEREAKRTRTNDE